MVGIISSIRAGLELGSRDVLGAAGLFGQAAHGRNGQGVYLNAANGRLVVQNRDELLVARGEDAAALRTYTSPGVDPDGLGGWSNGAGFLSVSGTLNTAGSQVWRTGADGSTARYDYDVARSLYVTTEGAGAHDAIAYLAAEGQFEWRDGATGATQRYEGSGAYRLLHSRDEHGNTLTYSYRPEGVLGAVVAGNGDEIRYDYTGGNLSQIRTIADGSTRTAVRYGYDANNRLTTVTVDLSPEDSSVADGRVYVTHYDYDGSSGRIAQIRQTDGTSLAFSYVDVGGGEYKLASVRDALNRTTSFAYAAGSTAVTDPQGFVTRYDYDAEGRLTKVTAPAVAGVAANRQFGYSATGDLLSVTDGEGRVTQFEYDERGNQVLQRDAAGNTVTRTFDARNQVLTETSYTQPDPDGPGASPPAGSLTTRQVYDAAGRNLLRFRISAEGLVTEHRYNAFGELVATVSYAGASYLGSLPADPSAAEAALATWAAGQDLTRTQRVDYAYDGRGQLQTRTSYAQVGADGAGLVPGRSVEHHVRDANGRLLQTVSANGGTTNHSYDGLGRVLTSSNALGELTVTQYDDAGGRTVLTLASGLVSTSAYDVAGQLTSVTRSSTAGAALGETRYFHDAGGRLRMTQDPTGVRQWVLYDEAGRKTADIDGNGSMVEYGYDQRGLLVVTTTWGTAVNTALLVDASGQPVVSATVGSVRPPASSADHVVWRQYDAAQRLVREASSIGDGATASVTEFRYDGASRLVQTVRYANAVSTSPASGQVAPGAVALPPASAQDRSTRHFHDADGRLAGVLDAEGFLTVSSYTAAGQLRERIAYATATDATLRATGTLAQLRPAAADADIRELTLYDAQGRATAVIDGENYLSETVYDAAGNVTQSIRYAHRVTSGGVAAALSTGSLAGVRPAASAADRSTARSYDALGRLVQESGPEGVLTRYAYDPGGNVVSTVRAADTSEARTLQARYDLLGRITGELSAAGSLLLTGGQTQAQVDAIWAQHGSTHTYDAAGRRTSTTEPSGQWNVFFYNADGALTHTVNALGEVKETRYDARGRIVESIVYGSRIGTAGIVGGLVPPALTSILAAIADPSRDSRTTFTYTRDGQAASSTDEVGTVTTSSFNTFSEEIARRVTGTGVDVTQTYTVDRRGLRTGTVSDAPGVNAVTSAVYDAFGRLVRSVDANGKASEQAYDRLGRVVSTRDPTNTLRGTSYDAFGRVLNQTDALGNATTYVYDAAARSVTVTTPEGVSTTTTTNRHGQVFSVRDGKGQVTSYVYDANGNLVRTDGPLSSTSSSFDASGRLIESVDANGHKVAYAYDPADRVLTRTVDPGGLNLLTRYEYDAKGQQVRVTDANGVLTTTEYDRKGRAVKQVVDPAGLRLETVYSYDARGQVLTVQSPGGTVTQYVYDALGRRVQERLDPAGLDLRRSWVYDRKGNVVASTDPLGNVTRYAYDAADRLLFTLDAEGGLQRNVYDAEGRIVKAVAYATPVQAPAWPAIPSAAQLEALVPAPANDRIEHRVYDRDGRLAATVDGTGAVVRYVHDANGNVVERTAFATPLNLAAWMPGTLYLPASQPGLDASVRTIYDAGNRAIFTVDGVGAVVAQTYDGNGNVLSRVAYAQAIPASTGMTQASLAAAVATIADPSRDASMRYSYDAAGRLAWTVDGARAVTQRIHDRNGNVVREVAYATPLAAGAAASSITATEKDRVTTLAYDAASRLVFRVDAVKAVTEQVFDADGRITQRVAYARALDAMPAIGSSSSIGSIRAALVAQPAADRVSRHGYDAAGREVVTIDPAGAVTETQYDAASHAITVTAYASAVDASGLPATASPASLRTVIAANPDADRVTRRAYDAAGRLVYTVDPLGAVTQRQYDGAGRLVRSTRYAKELPVLASYTEDAIALRVEPNAGKDQTELHTYDAAGRQASFRDALGATETYRYDALGRRLEFTNKKGSTWTYTYDAAGRMVSERTPEVWLQSGDITAGGPQRLAIETRMAYDALGNLLQRTEAVGRPEERKTRYEYDALGRQVRVIHAPVGVYDPSLDPLPGNGAYGLAPRTESVDQTLSTETFYDALGNAVANRDVGNGISQKVYDVAGRVSHEIDAMGYVTAYGRNAYGEVTSLVRYGSATGLANVSVTSAAQAASRAQVEAALSAPGFDHSLDRALLTTYDRAGRLQEKTEPEVVVFDPGSGQPMGRLAKKTFHVYNAFGELVQEQVERNAAHERVSTTHYYDRGGRERATVDAMGYLTERKFDLLGNLTSSKEYAKAVPAGWSIAGYAMPAATPAEDRVTEYAYDRLNRKVSETRLDVEYSTGPSDASVRGHLTTTYEYDAVGNQTRVTDAANNVTCSSYDALGRVTAVVAPARAGTQPNTSITPVTEFLRDAHGNVVVQIERSNGALASAGSAPAAMSADDRRTYSVYDRLGRKIQGTDANDSVQYFSYDAHGHLAKQWQGVRGNEVVNGNERVVRTTFELHQYDKLGRRVSTSTPAPNGYWNGWTIPGVGAVSSAPVVNTVTYNAFGEVTGKGVLGQVQEYFDYDNAGRLWRTNTGDGVDRVRLYDGLGNVTSEIRSSGSGYVNADMKLFANAEAAAADPSTRRVDTTYDALGRMVSRIETGWHELQGGVSVGTQHTTAVVQATASAPLAADGLPVLGSKNKVALTWRSMAALGSGDIKVQIQYRTAVNFNGASNPPGTEIRTFTSGLLSGESTSTTLEWAEARRDGQVGISEVTRITLWKKDADGAWRTVFDKDPGYGANELLLAAPPQPDSPVQLQFRTPGQAGENGWWTASSLVYFGSAYRLDAAGLGRGSYEYRVVVTDPNGTSSRTTAGGTITLTPPPLASITGLAFGRENVPAGVLSWPAVGDAYTHQFHYRPSGTNWAWNSLPANSLQYILVGPGTLEGVDASGLSAGTYEFELLRKPDGLGMPGSHATGTFTITASPRQYIVNVTTAPNSAAISTNEGSTPTQVMGANGDGRWWRPHVFQNTDRWGNVLEITDPRANYWKTTYRYNASNQVVQQTLPDAGAGTATTFVYYDQLGRQVATRDARGHVNGQEFDAAGNVTREVDAKGEDVQHFYDAFGNRVRTIDKLGRATDFVYDKTGNLLQQIRASVAVNHATTNYQLAHDGEKRLVDTWSYDELGRKLTHVNGNGETLKYAYDLVGNLIQTTQTMGQLSTLFYDAGGRKVAEIDANGNSSRWSYDYFGLLLERYDLGGKKYQYTYDKARQLTKQTSERGQDVRYEYDAAGQLKAIRDYTVDKTTTYVYDLSGRKVRERVAQMGVIYQDNNLAYDARGLLRDVADARAHVSMDYDQAGNRTRVSTYVDYQGTTGETIKTTNRYFQYDEMNRQVVVDAVDGVGNLSHEQGHWIEYDANGNRVKDRSWGTLITSTGGGEQVQVGVNHDGSPIYTTTPRTYTSTQGISTEVYEYDALDRLKKVVKDGVVTDMRFYDGAGRVVQSGPYAALDPQYVEIMNQGLAPDEMNGKETRLNRYDANGRLLHQRVFKSGLGKMLDVIWDPTITSPDHPFRADGYDAAGNVLGYVVMNYEAAVTNEFTHEIARFDGYQTSVTRGVSTSKLPGSTTQHYDANGFLVRIDDATQNANDRFFVNDANGRALYVNQGGNVQRQLIVNGEVLGRYGVGVKPDEPASGYANNPNFANVVDFNFGYARISANYPSAGVGSYTVRAGETLRSIAQGAYGDGALWYRIAEANGLASDNDLRVGQTLNIPSTVGTVHNNSTTFKPYDPSKIEGDKTPSLATAEPKKKNVLGMLLMVIVAVIMTFFVIGAMLSTASGFLEVVAAGAEIAASGAALSVGEIGTMAFAGAVGSAAGQVVGRATGVVDKFDWKGVGLSAISAGVTAGLAGSQFIPQQFDSLATRAAMANAMTQGVGVVTGLQSSFDWRGVVASGVGAGVGEAVGEALKATAATRAAEMSAGEVLGKALFKGAVAGTAAAAARGGRVVVQQVAVDAFGNALGQTLSAVSKSKGPSIYSLSTTDAHSGLSTSGSGASLTYRGRRATVEERTPPQAEPGIDVDIFKDLRKSLGLQPETPDLRWMLAAGPTQGRSLGGYGAGLPSARKHSTNGADGEDDSSALAGGIVGVGSSLGKLVLGGMRSGSNLIMQLGDMLTGGANHNHPLVQQVWAEQRAMGASIVNVIANPVAVATDLIEEVVYRYNLAMAQPTKYERSYRLGALFNDVGQGALGTGLLIRGAAKLGALGWEHLGENAFTGPMAGGRTAQIGAIDLRGLDPATRARILERFRGGNEFEAQARKAMDAGKNYDRIHGTGDLSGKYAVPDSMKSGIVEFKDVREISKDLQFQLYEQSGKRIELVVSPRAEYISGPLIESIKASNGAISIFDPRTRLFHAYDFDTGVFLIEGSK